MNRRGFLRAGLSAIIATRVAPAIITTPGVLMPARKIITSKNPLFVGAPGCWDGIVVRRGGAGPMRRGVLVDFGALSEEQKRAWARAVWRAAQPMPQLFPYEALTEC